MYSRCTTTTKCTDDVLGCTLGELHDVQHDDGNSALGVYGGDNRLVKWEIPSRVSIPNLGVT